MPRITLCSLQPAPIHAVVVLQVLDGQFHRLAPLEPPALLLRRALKLVRVDDLNARLGPIHHS